mgnify:CR=1 FL=1
MSCFTTTDLNLFVFYYRKCKSSIVNVKWIKIFTNKLQCIKDIEKIYLLYGNRLLHKSTHDKRFGLTYSIPGMHEACKTEVVFNGSSSMMGLSCVLLFIFILDKERLWKIKSLTCKKWVFASSTRTTYWETTTLKIRQIIVPEKNLG